MNLLRGFSVCVTSLGVAIGLLRVEICSPGCILDDLGDALLPVALESMSGGVPFVIVGILLWVASPRD